MWRGFLQPDNSLVGLKWAAVTLLHPEKFFRVSQVISPTPPAARWRQGWV